MIRLVTLVALLLAGAGPSAQNPPAATPKALAPLQGTWVLAAPDGSTMANAELALVITGNKYAQTLNGEVNERGTITLDPAAKPMAIDLAISEGPDAGKTQLGVIEVSGDAMKGALKAPGDTVRPADFTPQAGVITFVAKRKAK